MTKYLVLILIAILTMTTTVIAGCNDGVEIIFKITFPTKTCSKNDPEIIKNTDGTYRRDYTTIKQPDHCLKVFEHKEWWTDYPENGGTFIRH